MYKPLQTVKFQVRQLVIKPDNPSVKTTLTNFSNRGVIQIRDENVKAVMWY